MTIENTLERIAVALETIAAGGALPKPEGKAKSGTTKPASPAKEASSSEKAKASTKPASKPSKPASSNEDGPSISDVRKSLGALQKVTSPDEARALLKEVGGAATMSKLAEDMYQAVIDAALKAAADAE